MTQTEEFSIPCFKVEGDSYEEIGRRIGAHFKDRIQAGLKERKKWVDHLERFASEDASHRKRPFLAAIREHCPHLEEELKGIAEGAEVPFSSLFAVSVNPELSALMKKVSHEDCTNVAVRSGDRLMIGHNEDGSCAYRDYIYLLDVTWPTGKRSLCLSYPGYLPGNGPSMNTGVVQCVNYIGAREVGEGVPRYYLDRMIMEADNLDHALSIATETPRAYSQHHLLMGDKEGRIVSVETSPSAHSVIEVEGIFVHANHYVHPSMKDVPQITAYKGSSRPRQQAAEEWAREIGDPAAIGEDEILSILSSHKNWPFSICRHPDSKASGCTLGAAIIGGKTKKVRLFEHEPCRGVEHEFDRP